MTAALTPVPKIQFFANDGTPLVGGKLYSYAAGTTTPLATYTTYAGNVANTNPVILDSRGEANVWLGANVYKLALYDADNALIWTVDNITPEGDASLVTYLPAGAGAVVTTVQDKLRESVSVKDFGAVGDGVTDDTAAIQAAINYIGAAGGGTVRLPKSVYKTTSTLTIDYNSVELVGDGGLSGNYPLVVGSAGVVGEGQHTGATRIFASFTSGPVIRVKKSSCALIELCIDGDATRRLAALSTNYGVWLEAADSVGEQSNRFYMHRCRITNQPSHGVVMVNSIVHSRLDMVDIDNIWGHGIYISGGVLSGRTNKTRPGQVQINLCRVTRNGGHSILVGGNDTLTLDIPYRVDVAMAECFYNGIVSGLLLDTVCAYVSGENHRITDSAFAGSTEFPLTDVYSGLALRGDCMHVDNMRAIDCNPYAIKITGHPALGSLSKAILIQNLYVNSSFQSTGFYNPAVFYTSSVRNVNVSASDTYNSQVATLSSMAVGSYAYEEFDNQSNNDRANKKRTVAVSGFASGVGNVGFASNTTLAADTASYIEFSGAAQGMISISGNVAARGCGVVFFRVGASAHSTLVSSAGATVSVGTGALTTGAGDGVAGSLNVYADTATNRLYIKNRTTATGQYGYTLLNVQPDITAGALVII